MVAEVIAATTISSPTEQAQKSRDTAWREICFDYPDGVAQFIQHWFARHPELGERLLAELATDGKESIRDPLQNRLRWALLYRTWQR